MNQIISLNKVLLVREREKKNAQLAHYQSMDFFEGIATKLYKILKEKENAEDCYDTYIQEKTAINKITEQMTYIDSLNSKILKLQQEVSTARDKMDLTQVDLTDAHIEVKKFEKVIEMRRTEREKAEQKLEQSEMDEISTQQYLNRQLGE